MRALLVGALLAAGLVQAGLVEAADAAPRILNRYVEAEPESIDPHKTSGLPEFRLQQDLFEGLTAFGADGSTIPGTAERWDVSADGLTYTFHLRPNLTWSDGTPFTAADIVYSFRRVLDPKTASPYTAVLMPIRNAEAVIAGKLSTDQLAVSAPDGHTVVIKLEAPTAYFPSLLTNQVAMPVPQAVVEKWGQEWVRPEHFVGNGAFILTAWVPQSHLDMTRNQRFHDAASVKSPGIHWSVDPRQQTAFDKFRSGELDLATAPVQNFAWIKKNMPEQLVPGPYLAYFHIGVNMRPSRVLGKDARLRHALGLALDQRALNDKVLPLDQIPAFGLVPPLIEGYYPATVDYADWPMPKRLAEAKRLFAEAGYGPDHPLELELLYPTNPEAALRYQAVAAMWQPLGVKLKLTNREWQVFLATNRNGQFDLNLQDWIADFPDPWTFLSNFMSTSDLNYIGYHNADYDRLTTAAAATVDPAKRFGLLHDAEAVLLADYAVLPDLFANALNLVRPGVQGWTANPMAQHPSRYLWIEGPTG